MLHIRPFHAVVLAGLLLLGACGNSPSQPQQLPASTTPVTQDMGPPAPPTEVAAPAAIGGKSTWVVNDPEGYVTETGIIPAGEQPNSGNSCFGMQSSKFVCRTFIGGQTLFQQGMITAPEPRAEHQAVFTQAQAYPIPTKCSDGTDYIGNFDVQGFGPARAIVLNVNEVLPGQWKYLEFASGCSDEKGVTIRVGWAEYPTSMDKVVFHLWDHLDRLPPVESALNGAEFVLAAGDRIAVINKEVVPMIWDGHDLVAVTPKNCIVFGDHGVLTYQCGGVALLEIITAKNGVLTAKNSPFTVHILRAPLKRAS